MLSLADILYFTIHLFDFILNLFAMIKGAVLSLTS